MGNSSSEIFEQEAQGVEGQPAAADRDWMPEADLMDAADAQALGGQSSDVDTPEVLMLKSQIEQLEKRLQQQEEEFLRAQAEAQNIRRRAQKDIENAHKFALDSFINALLPVVDSLEQGVAMLNAEDEALTPAREGALLTLKMLLDTLSKQNVEPLSPLHQAFNPEQHQAMTLQPSDEHAPNTVLNVLQKGYLLHGRVLRPALVVVAKAATPS
jgi:molecular chaperone GrpE